MQASVLGTVAPKILSLMRQGIDHYGALRESGAELDAGVLTLFLLVKLDGWSPAYKGEPVLDEEGKLALATFLGHLAYRLGTIHHAVGDA